MLSNLLLYRFAILNSLAGTAAAALLWSGHVRPVFATDQSRLTIAIAALFIVGWLWTLKEVVIVSRELNAARQRSARPACDAMRDKDMAKTEWLASVSEWLVSLGLLGTVIGFAMALSGIDQGSLSAAGGAQSAVTSLMKGMRVALNTTLVGATLALWHEVNVRMLRTALTVYWADRIAAWHMGRPIATDRFPAAPARHRSEESVAIPTSRWRMSALAGAAPTGAER